MLTVHISYTEAQKQIVVFRTPDKLYFPWKDHLKEFLHLNKKRMILDFCLLNFEAKECPSSLPCSSLLIITCNFFLLYRSKKVITLAAVQGCCNSSMFPNWNKTVKTVTFFVMNSKKHCWTNVRLLQKVWLKDLLKWVKTSINRTYCEQG